jgi:predicted NBD/HSP70 family sugar kinase
MPGSICYLWLSTDQCWKGASGDSMVTMGAIADDPVALAAFQAVGTWLGHGLADLAAILDPRVFIIGGGVRHAKIRRDGYRTTSAS